MSTRGGSGTDQRRASQTVPSPVPPDDPEAWYAPDVRTQDEVFPGVVITVRERDRGFEYDVLNEGCRMSRSESC